MKLNLVMSLREFKERLENSVDGDVKIHEMEVYGDNFTLIQNGIKRMDIRLNDGYRVGDYILMRAYDVEKDEYTGDIEVVKISYTSTYAQIGDNIAVGFVPVSLAVSLGK